MIKCEVCAHDIEPGERRRPFAGAVVHDPDDCPGRPVERWECIDCGLSWSGTNRLIDSFPRCPRCESSRVSDLEDNPDA